MKQFLSIVLLLPIIIALVIIDIIKIPLMLIFAPITFFLALSDYLCGNSYWFNDWISLNLEFGCFTYLMGKELFYYRY